MEFNCLFCLVGAFGDTNGSCSGESTQLYVQAYLY